MIISAHEEQLATITSLCKQEMKLLLGAKAGQRVSTRADNSGANRHTSIWNTNDDKTFQLLNASN